jgi:hypothetical protein
MKLYHLNDYSELLRNLRAESSKFLTLKTNMEVLKPEIRRQKFEDLDSTSFLQSQVADTARTYMRNTEQTRYI